MDQNLNIPTRLNNPGSLKDPATGQFRQFNSPQEGYAALLNDLEGKKTGRTQTGLGPQSTLVDFAKVYAPASDKNNPAQYAANLANHMRVRPDATLASLDTGKWAEAVANAEGYQGAQPNNNFGTQSPESTEKPKVGFIQGMVQGIAHPFLKAAANVGAAFNSGNPEEYNRIQKEGVDFGYLGKARPIGSEYNDKGEKRTFGQRVADTVGTGLEASTYLAPGGAALKSVEAIAGGKALPVILKGAFTGAEAGLLQGAGSGLQQDNATVGSVAKDAGLTALGGAALGGATGAIGGQVGKLFGKGKVNSAVNNNLKGLSELENANAPLRRYVADQSSKGFDVKSDIAKTDLLKGSVDKEGIIRTGDAIAQYQKALEGKESVVRNVLQKEGATMNASDLQKQVFDSIEKSGLQGAAKKRAQQEALADIEQFVSETGSNNIPLTLIHDAKVSRYNTLNYSNPESGIAGKAIAKGYKQAVQDGTKSIEVKDINRELQRHFANIGFLEKLDGKRVQGGRLGKYFAQTIGGIAGSHFGPLGSIVGADVAGRIMGRNLSSKFGKETGGLIPQASEAMKRAVRISEGTERKIPVKSLKSDFTNELPTIEFGKSAIPKTKKKLPGLPTIR